MGFYHNTTYTFWDPRYPGRDWVDYMNNSIKELVDLYHPSILWGDTSQGPVKDEQGRLPSGGLLEQQGGAGLFLQSLRRSCRSRCQ